MSHSEYIAARLEQARAARGIPVTELARRAGVDERRLWFILKRNRSLRADELIRLCSVLNLGFRHFLSPAMAAWLESVRRKIDEDYGTGAVS